MVIKSKTIQCHPGLEHYSWFPQVVESPGDYFVQLPKACVLLTRNEGSWKYSGDTTHGSVV